MSFVIFHGIYVDRPEKVKGQAGTKIKHFAPAPKNAYGALQMALFTNGFAQRGLQVSRIDDGFIHGVHSWILFTERDMKLARPMTALAANGFSAKKRRSILIHRVGHRLNLIRMAKKALGRDRTI